MVYCRTRSRILALSALLAAVSCLILSGCGTDAYEKEYASTLSRLRKETPFQPLWGKQTLVSDPPAPAVMLRLPKFFDAQSYAFDATSPVGSPDPRKSTEPLDPFRVQPYFLELPGYQRTFEGFTPESNEAAEKRAFKLPQLIDSTSGTPIGRPYYLYVAIAGSRLSHGKPFANHDIAERLRGELIEEFGNQVTAWEQVDLPTPEGRSIPWQRLKATGEQDFNCYYSGGNATYKIMPGEYLLYLHSTDNYHVMLGWRAPTEVAELLHLDAVAALCAGTLKVAP